MSMDPQAQFEETVMEMIEHSPTGAVPHTPSYDEAVKRLAQARKIYAHADHKDGWVTARALGRQPTFHASNWEEFVAGKISDVQLEPNASVFNRYLLSLPAAAQARAEGFRARVAGKPILHRAKAGAVFHDPIHALFLVPGSGPNGGLPGNYLHGSVIQLGEATAGPWAVDVHDADDDVVLFDAATLQAAADKLQEVLECAPFYLLELEGLGFRRK